MAATQSTIEFNCEQSKAVYMAQIAKYFDEDSTNSEKTIKTTIQLLKVPTKSYLQKFYEIMNSFGREILIEKRKSATDPVVQVITFEDVFDVFMKDHIQNNHAGGHQHLKQVEQKLRLSGFIFKFPIVCLSLLVKSCNVCSMKLRKPRRNVNKVGSVYVSVMIQGNTESYFRYLLIYIDKATDYVVLRPLKKKTGIEIALEIFKILMAFGPPQKLRLYGYNCDFYKNVGRYLRLVCPMFNFAIEYKPANFDPPAVVVDKLQEWMTLNESISWEIGCSVVQKQLNMEVRQTIRLAEGNKYLSPHDLFFGKKYTIRAEPGTITLDQNTNNDKKTKKNRLHYCVTKQDSHISKIKKPNDTRYLKTDVVDDDIVELRIPSPENYDWDLLSQFEEPEANQESIGEIVKEEHEMQERSIAKAPNVTLSTQNMNILHQEGILTKETIQSIKEKEIDKRVKHIMSEKESTNENVVKKNICKRKRKQTLHSIDFNEPSEFNDLNCKDSSESHEKLVNEIITDQTHVNINMSVRSVKNKSTEDFEVEEDEENIIEDDELMCNLNDVNIEDAKDPLHMEEEITDPIDMFK